ncbi:BatA domain-containing protein [Aureitalea marina]|uniref:FHA domain-containing protein n=1 Tax=Aureitalea marina TaxID=930804 RepID=A0A2S7KPF3_9FLAO|nr:BatA domain-containing protein [Aureitalea marina]PQB04487.1 hypothetical protein BST85_05915 [Aureitalea marina]
MQFTYPTLLYGLFLLLIPIIIHLFQLRRFQRVKFTNVAFLKRAKLQTRKSSELKRWLTLITRMLALACMVLAFAQPYSTQKTDRSERENTVIYLDNSFSMQAKGEAGSLLERGIQDLYESVSQADDFQWFTNSDTYTNASVDDFRRQVLQVTYSSAQMSTEQMLLKANQLLGSTAAGNKRLIMITDLHQPLDLPESMRDIQLDLVRLSPVNRNNTSIDTAYLMRSEGEGTRLRAKVSHRGSELSEIPISLFKADTLIAKTAVSLSDSGPVSTGVQSGWINFDLEQYPSFIGRLEINDGGLNYDNSLFFNWGAQNEVSVMIIEESNTDYLLPLYQQQGFQLNRQPADNINFNDISSQDFIVLHELEQIPMSLRNSLIAYYQNGGHLFVIPPELMDRDQYNQLLSALNAGILSSWIPAERNIASINFDHPLFSGVFEREVSNFQYPTVSGYHRYKGSNMSTVISYENGDDFLLAKERLYVSTAPLSADWSTFQFSPLIVPTLFNMAQLSLPNPELYFEIGRTNSFALDISLSQDEILSLQDSLVNFIPLQQAKANSVVLTTTDQPSRAGTYGVYQNDERLKSVSYDYNRNESLLTNAQLPEIEGLNVFDSVPELWQEINERNQVTGYWKWFVIFAVVLLLIEMCILRFIK